jgi:hypothetical protein
MDAYHAVLSIRTSKVGFHTVNDVLDLVSAGGELETGDDDGGAGAMASAVGVPAPMASLQMLHMQHVVGCPIQ